MACLTQTAASTGTDCECGCRLRNGHLGLKSGNALLTMRATPPIGGRTYGASASKEMAAPGLMRMQQPPPLHNTSSECCVFPSLSLGPPTASINIHRTSSTYLAQKRSATGSKHLGSTTNEALFSLSLAGIGHTSPSSNRILEGSESIPLILFPLSATG